MAKMFGSYYTYNFTDKDPIIDYLRTVIEDQGKTIMELSHESGVSYQTISNWIYGNTRRPQAAPLNAVLRACNYKLHVARFDAPEFIYPTVFHPKAVKPKSVMPQSVKPTHEDNVLLRMKMRRQLKQEQK